MNRLQYYLKHRDGTCSIPHFAEDKTYHEIEVERNLINLCNQICVTTRICEELGIYVETDCEENCISCWMRSMPPGFCGQFNSLLDGDD